MTVPTDAVCSTIPLDAATTKSAGKANRRPPGGIDSMLAESAGAVLDTVHPEYPIEHNRLRGETTEMTIGAAKVPVSSIEHLIAAKRAVTTMRKIDQRDIEDLQELLRGGRSTES